MTDEVKLNSPKTSDNEVRSNAVITYSAAKFPALYNQLAPLTNLNLAPSNWLRKAQGLRPNHLISRSRPSYSDTGRRDMPLFTSFTMADKHLDIIGKIDVVSDAENIKKLLKMPFSKAQISMAVHRVGKTLLLEQFDFLSKRFNENESSWLFNIQQQLCNGPNLPKKKLPSAQNERLMLSKFLYYSVNANETERPDSPTTTTNIDSADPDVLKRIQEVVSVPSDGNKPVEPNAIVPADLRWKFWTPGTGSFKTQDIEDSFERTICWSFEDLQMLLGTNMPIFGGGEYPAVSLKLRDSSKPINVLTGIDYWLDNLICNVPEVVMCFHVNGIVKNYEVIRTEDIPKLEGSRFHPKVIKDIAQNILSFLKSNCTKEGHTYWLFKGGNEDDVVKLYDLTMLCNQKKERSNGSSHNPFTLSVATLLYKMAVNMMQQLSVASSNKSTIKQLLKNCVGLLEKNSDLDPVMRMGALCMLSTLCLPDTFDTQETEITRTDPQTANLLLTPHSEEKANTEVAVIPSATELSIPEKYRSKTLNQSTEVETDGCHTALNHIIQALNISVEEENEPELLEIKTQLYRNISLAYYSLANYASKQQRMGSSLQYLRLALQSYELLDYLMILSKQHMKKGVKKNGGVTSPPDFHLLLPRLLMLCGDIQWSRSQSTNEEEEQTFKEQFFALSDSEIAMCEAMNKITLSAGKKYVWLSEPSNAVADSMEMSRQCYMKAIEALPFPTAGGRERKQKQHLSKLKTEVGGKNRTQSSTNDNDMAFMIKRKLGYVANEQGALGIADAVSLLNDNSYKDKENYTGKQKEVWKVTFSYLELALSSFTAVNDVTNQALVLSNLGKLMRICAQSMAQDENEQFTHNEEKLHNRAIEYYLQALSNQGHEKCDDTSKSLLVSIHNNLSWEVSGAYYTMAQRVQDHSPLHLKSREQIEHQTSDLLHKSLKHCSNVLKSGEKRSQAILRCAKIHHRLASLHHNSYRNMTESTKRRHNKMLAGSHYDKAISHFKQLSNEMSIDYFRVLLEKLAMHETLIEANVTSNPSAKVKLILEALGLALPCVAPLNKLQDSLQEFIAHHCDSSTPVDRPDSSSDQITPSAVAEWTSLTNVLSTILQALLLSLVKFSGSNRSSNSKKRSASSGAPNAAPTQYKDLYMKTLHSLHTVKDGSKGSNSNQLLLQRVTSLITVLAETKALLKK